MAGLALLLLITLAISHWLLEPLLTVATGLFTIGGLPWMVLGLGAYLLAGQSDGRR